MYCQTKNIDYLIFRIFSLDQEWSYRIYQVIPEFIRKAKHDKTFEIIGDGQNTRSFCFVDDHVKMVCDLAFSSNSGTFNIGESDEITISHLAKIVHKIVGRNFKTQYTEPRPHDTIRRCPDISKVLEAIKKVDFTTIEDGIRKMI